MFESPRGHHYNNYFGAGVVYRARGCGVSLRSKRFDCRRESFDVMPLSAGDEVAVQVAQVARNLNRRVTELLLTYGGGTPRRSIAHLAACEHRADDRRRR